MKKLNAVILALLFAAGSVFAASAQVAEEATVEESAVEEAVVHAEVSAEEAVAMVGTTYYSTIDDAISAWTNGTTLTLMSDVTLSNTITLNSNEKHILNLGEYTMSIGTTKTAIKFAVKGRTNAGDALVINAEDEGGISAGTIISYSSFTGKDRSIITINGGTYHGSINISCPNNTNAAQLYITDGVFYGTISGRSPLVKISGGIFHKKVSLSVASNSYAQITGGRFFDIYSDSDLTNYQKFFFGTNTDDRRDYSAVDVFVDADGYYVVTKDVDNNKPANFKAMVTKETIAEKYTYRGTMHNNGFTSNMGLFEYTKAVDEGLFYKVAAMAVEQNSIGTVVLYDNVEDADVTTSGNLTHVLTDDRAMYSGTVTLKKGHTYTVKFNELDGAALMAEEDIPFKGKVVSAVDSSIVDYTETTADGIVTRVYSLESVTEGVSVMFKATDDANVYEIYAVANDDGKINRFSSAQLKFNIENDVSNRTDVAYTLAPAEFVKMSEPDEDGYVLFNFDGVNEADSGVGEEVLFATVTFEGYGKFTFSTVDSADKAMLHTAKPKDNIVVDYTVAGDSEGKYNLVLSGANVNADNEDGAFGDIIDTELYVPVNKLTVKIDFPNAVENKISAYQQMKLTVSGTDLEQNLIIDLGELSDVSELDVYNGRENPVVTPMFKNGMYVVEIDGLLTQNTSYVVTVEGAGYRTTRYTVTMTDNKTLNFWNNVKDNDFAVEEGKTTSAKKVTFLAGDIVKDSLINIYDLSAVVSYFGETGLVSTNNAYAKYDLNRDGKIDSKDVAYVLVSWGN